MINAVALLRDLKRLTTTIEADIRERLTSTPDLDASLDSEWQAAKDAARTGATLHDFKEEAVTQAAVHWLLMGVFIRFLEDNALIDRPYLTAADPARRALAQDRHETYFRQHPGDSDREYLLAAFREVGALPAMGALFDERHNPLFRLAVSGDGAMAILGFWQKINPDTGALIHDFSDPDWNTRFLGDLYQDLSESAQKKFALLQTPEFVEEFILDRTLTPAINEFGYREVRLIDPTCGSGHFLLGGFIRLLDQWQRNEPGRNARDAVQRALDGIYGVDLNPFAVAISRFRLLIAALRACGETELAAAPNFKFHLAAGDSLLHGPVLGRQQDRSLFDSAETHRGTVLEHAFASEDLTELNRILGQRYHAVVGNPPYITVKDAALNAAYRSRYATCHMKYSLGVPFTERFFELAMPGNERESAGYVGLITTNSFMKREFGKPLIEKFLPRVDLTYVIDTKNAYIPHHGTATVILFGRNRAPISSVVRTVMTIRAESTRPANPARGNVWLAISGQVDLAGSESMYASVADWPRDNFASHPWSLGGGGAAELKEVIEAAASKTIDDFVEEVGFGCIISEEEAFFSNAISRREIEKAYSRELVIGDNVRDWGVDDGINLVFPYDNEISLLPLKEVNRGLWWARTLLAARRAFGNRTYKEAGRPWWEFHQIPVGRNRIKLSITFAFVSTQNHFVLDRGGKAFKQTAPVMKLKANATENDHLQLLGELNSSVACFWMKQTFMDKGGGGIGGGLATEAWEKCYEHDSTKARRFPIVEPFPLEYAIALDAYAQELRGARPTVLFQNTVPNRNRLDEARLRGMAISRKMIATQEELDWHCYRLYGLTQSELTCPNPPEIAFGERAFEIVLARRIDASLDETTWFTRHGATPITELPSHWSEEYRGVVEARIALIESDKSIGLIERPEYKRRWAASPWAEQEQVALKTWLLERLESTLKNAAANTPNLVTTNKLTDQLRADVDFMQVAELYAGRSDFDVAILTAELVACEAVPVLPVLRYKESGLRKRAAWEQTWSLQRREDYGEYVGEIPVPPKYKLADFLKPDFWRLRDALDAPKERFVSFPHCSRDADGSLLIAWAGLNPLQLGTAIATHYLDMKDNEGWDAERLKPLLAAIAELAPWVKQWHNEPDAEHGTRMGDYLDGFVDEEARGLGLTREAVVGWQPPATTARRGRRSVA